MLISETRFFLTGIQRFPKVNEDIKTITQLAARPVLQAWLCGAFLKDKAGIFFFFFWMEGSTSRLQIAGSVAPSVTFSICAAGNADEPENAAH